MKARTLALVAMLLASPVYAGDQNAAATSGSSSGAAAGAGAYTGDTTVVVDQSGNVANIPKEAASPAASLFIGGCQEGASGASYSGGASSAFESAQCSMLRQAAENQKLAAYFEARGDKATADLYLKRMGQNMADAEQSAETMYYPKQVGGFFLTILPVGLLFLL